MWLNQSTKAAHTEANGQGAAVRWGIALLGVAIIVGLVGGFAVPSRVRYILFVGFVLAALVLMLRTRGGKARQVAEIRVNDSDLIAVVVVPNQVEAQVVRGMLQANGVPSRCRQTNFGAGSMDGMPGGLQEVLLRETDVSRAREVLAKAH